MSKRGESNIKKRIRPFYPLRHITTDKMIIDNPTQLLSVLAIIFYFQTLEDDFYQYLLSYS